MIDKQKKWVAILVTVTFIWLLQVSAQPVSAAGGVEQIGAANAEPESGFSEAAGQKAAPPKGKSFLPYVLIGVGVVAVTAVLILFVFKTTYDIVGTWTFVYTGPYDATLRYAFVGDKKSGIWSTVAGGNDGGTYTVDGKNVTMTVTGMPSVQLSGQFTGKNEMTGSWVQNGSTWNFTATRDQTAAGVRTPVSSPKVPHQSQGPSAAD